MYCSRIERPLLPARATQHWVVSFLYMLLTMLCIGLLTGCDRAAKISPSATANSSASSASQSTPVPPKQIALVIKTRSNPFFLEMEKGARRAEKELGIRLIVRAAASETSIEQQIQFVEELIIAKVNAIVIAPGDSQRLVPVLKKAQMAGIKLINIDNQLNPEAMSRARMSAIPFISVDNEQASYEAVRFMTKQVKQAAKAGIVEGIRSAENSNSRLRGARRGFEENPLIKIVASESANWKIDEANIVAARMFAAHPDISLVFCANDMMAMGVLKYLQDQNRNNVLIASYDALDDIRDAIKDGRVLVSVDQQAALQGYQGIAQAYKLLVGESVPLIVKIDARLVSAAQLH